MSPPRFRLATMAVVLVVALGLVTALTLMLGAEDVDGAAWPETPSVILAKLTLVCLLFLGYLLYEQYRITDLRGKLTAALTRSEEERERRHDQMTGVLTLARLGSETAPQAIFNSITELVRYMFPCDQTSLMMVDATGESLDLRAASGHPDLPQILNLGQRVGHGIAGRVAASREALLLGPHVDRSQYPEQKTRGYSISSAMVVPVVHDGGLVGVLSVTSRDPEVGYSLDDLRVAGGLRARDRAVLPECVGASTLGLSFSPVDPPRTTRRVMSSPAHSPPESATGAT